MIQKIRLFIIDEHSAVCQALKVRLRSSPVVEVVGSACQFPQLFWMAPIYRPDVVILGLTRRDTCQPERVEQMVQQLAKWGIAVVILTSYADDSERERLLQAGARRYLLKDINTPSLISEIEKVVEDFGCDIRQAGTITLNTPSIFANPYT